MATEKRNRLKMKREERAKQFAPFAALKGYEEALWEKERIMVRNVELSEDAKEELDRQLSSVSTGDLVKIVYKKDDGFLETEGVVSIINRDSAYLKIIYTKIDFCDIYSISTESEKRQGDFAFGD